MPAALLVKASLPGDCVLWERHLDPYDMYNAIMTSCMHPQYMHLHCTSGCTPHIFAPTPSAASSTTPLWKDLQSEPANWLNPQNKEGKRESIILEFQASGIMEEHKKQLLIILITHYNIWKNMGS